MSRDASPIRTQSHKNPEKCTTFEKECTQLHNEKSDAKNGTTEENTVAARESIIGEMSKENPTYSCIKCGKLTKPFKYKLLMLTWGGYYDIMKERSRCFGCIKEERVEEARTTGVLCLPLSLENEEIIS